MASWTVLFALVAVAVATIERFDDGEPVDQKVFFISDSCKQEKDGDQIVLRNCYPIEYADIELTKEKTWLLRLLRTLRQWTAFKAVEGGYHIRGCLWPPNKPMTHKTTCLFWKVPKDDNWSYLTLTDEPESRFEITKVGYSTMETKDGRKESGGAYLIAILDQEKYKYVSYYGVRGDWLCSDDDKYYWNIGIIDNFGSF